jgi:hypothetical protein
MTVLAISTLGFAGLLVLGAALLVLLVSLLHPEGLRRPGGYLDGAAPQREEREGDDDIEDGPAGAGSGP